jgi:hypothetical protein
METWYIFRCDRCGSLTYPIQEANGIIKYEEPDESNVPDKCYMGHRWVLGMWAPVRDI